MQDKDGQNIQQIFTNYFQYNDLVFYWYAYWNTWKIADEWEEK